MPQASEAIYTYDPFGRRISKTVDGVTTEYLYDGDQVIAEYDGSGTLLRKFIYGSGIDEPILMDDGTNKYYYHFDGLGSVTALSDTNGDLTEEYTFINYWFYIKCIRSLCNRGRVFTLDIFQFP